MKFSKIVCLGAFLLTVFGGLIACGDESSNNGSAEKEITPKETSDNESVKNETGDKENDDRMIITQK